jgi:serine/threonine protein phosphatase PrpC
MAPPLNVGTSVDQGDEKTNGTIAMNTGRMDTMAEHNGSAPGDPSEQSNSGDQSDSSGASGQLSPGSRLGPYSIERVLRTGTDEAVYLARIVHDAELLTGDELLPPAYVTVTQRPAGSLASAAPIVDVAPRHPRLLAPLALHSRDGSDFLVVEALVTDGGELAPTIADGVRLGPTDTLMAGAGLADTLSYLHRTGIAHLHVSPDTIAVLQGRAFLSGMQSAELVSAEPDDHSALFARDANFLARTLGVLSDAAEAAEDVQAAESLRQIVARGESNGFTSPDDLAAACGGALQSAPVLPSLAPEQARAALALAVGTATSVGRVRDENQDACACALLDVSDDRPAALPLGVFLVADGMGGEARGELASRIASRITVAELVRNFTLPIIALPAMDAIDDGIEPLPSEPPADRLGRALTRSIETANRQIRALARKLGQTTGSTITAAAVCGNRLALAHIGDSRAYLMRDGSLVQLTEDHSVLARLQAMDHPLLSDPEVFVPRSMLYRSLGQEDEANPDTLEFVLAPGDRLLLCSDGLWDELDDALLADVLAGATDPRACAEQLVALANQAGGHDNSTAIVAFVLAVAQDEPVSANAGTDAGAAAAEGGDADASQPTDEQPGVQASAGDEAQPEEP